MNIIMLHSNLSADSRALVASLGVAIPEGDDVAVTVGSDTVRIISDHSAAVGICLAFPGYPTALIGEGETQRMLPFPSSWGAVVAWAGAVSETPTEAPEASITMSVTAFLERFTNEELLASRALARTDNVVDLFWARLLGADIIDLAYPPVVAGVRYLVGKLPGFDSARGDAVLGVVATETDDTTSDAPSTGEAGDTEETTTTPEAGNESAEAGA